MLSYSQTGGSLTPSLSAAVLALHRQRSLHSCPGCVCGEDHCPSLDVGSIRQKILRARTIASAPRARGTSGHWRRSAPARRETVLNHGALGLDTNEQRWHNPSEEPVQPSCMPPIPPLLGYDPPTCGISI